VDGIGLPLPWTCYPNGFERNAVAEDASHSKIRCVRAVDVMKRIGPGKHDVVRSLLGGEILHRFWNANKRGAGWTHPAEAGEKQKEDGADRIIQSCLIQKSKLTA